MPRSIIARLVFVVVGLLLAVLLVYGREPQGRPPTAPTGFRAVQLDVPFEGK